MKHVVRMPATAGGTGDAVLARWLVGVGDLVAEGQVIAEVESDKAVVDLITSWAGWVEDLVAPEGAVCAPGVALAVVVPADGSGHPPGDDHAPPPDPPPAAADAERTTEPPTSAASTGRARPREVPRIFANPLVRRMAREHQIDLGQIVGSGPGGRIVRRDLDAVRASAAQPDDGSTDWTEVPLTGMRRAIAERLTASIRDVPTFSISADCRVDALLAARAQFRTTEQVAVSVTALVVRAVAVAMGAVADFNAQWTPHALRHMRRLDVAIAVAVEGGGIVAPVARDIGDATVTEIDRSIGDLARRARAGRLTRADLDGGSFTVSNLGMYGAERFTAIITPPHSGILAIGAATPRPVVDDGRLGVATVLTVTLTADHRVVDGAQAARFLTAFVGAVERPLALFLDPRRR